MLVDYQKVQIYQADTLVLKDVDFQVEEGEFIYLIGKVGSGKSSLLKPSIVSWISTQKREPKRKC